MDTSSFGHPAEGDRDGDANAVVDGDDGAGDGDGGWSCRLDGDGGSGLRAGKFRRMVAAVASEDAGGSALLAALTEYRELLSFCTKDAGGYFPIESASRALMRLASAEVASPDEMLLAVRAITYLCDAMPRTTDSFVCHVLARVRGDIAEAARAVPVGWHDNRRAQIY